MKQTHKIVAGVFAASLIALSSAFASDKPAADADNTSRNEKDRDKQSVTPLDQGKSKADIDTTKRIRKEILAIKSLSTDAHNAKIVTQNGQVTLRGPVATLEEKMQLGEIASKIAQPENVSNQLEVKAAAAADKM